MNKKIFKEMLKQMNIISYNDREIVENTWENSNIKGKVPKTFEEDLDSDNIIFDTFIPQTNQCSGSDSYVRPKLVTIKNITNKEIII